jgi:SpoU rRNA methylase family enzyme
VKHNQETSIYTSALTTGVTTLEEFAEHAKKTRIVLEELERKIDVLLNELESGLRHHFSLNN